MSCSDNGLDNGLDNRTNEGLVLKITELKEKLDRYEARELESNEVSIKTELNTFESLLKFEGK